MAAAEGVPWSTILDRAEANMNSFEQRPFIQRGNQVIDAAPASLMKIDTEQPHLSRPILFSAVPTTDVHVRRIQADAEERIGLARAEAEERVLKIEQESDSLIRNANKQLQAANERAKTAEDRLRRIAVTTQILLLEIESIRKKNC